MPAVKRQRTSKVTRKNRRLSKNSTALAPQASSRWSKTPKAYVNFGYALPKRVENTHRYYEYQSDSLAFGASRKIYYRANGMYDPTVAAGGHQPMLFDQLSALYNHFTVVQSRCKLIISPAIISATASNSSTIVCLSIDDNASDTRAVQDIIETDSNAKWGVMSPESKLTLVTDWKAADYFGGDIIDNPNFRGSASADPTEQSVYTISYQNLSGSVTQYYDVFVLIEYRAVWSELKDVQAS